MITPIRLATVVLVLPLSLLGRKYSTTFPSTENPLSEGGMWMNGAATGMDWCNVRTTPGLAWGVEPCPAEYGDPTAILAGVWGADQSVEATAHIASTNSRYYQEIELHLRRKMSAHRATGYEVNFGVSHAYLELVRWNGARGDFTYLGPPCQYPNVCARVNGLQIRNGDVARAVVVGHTITVYLNNVRVAVAEDSTFDGGSPGLGFNYGCDGTYGTHGWSSFSATDDLPAVH